MVIFHNRDGDLYFKRIFFCLICIPLVQYNTKDWITFIFHFYQSDTFRKLLPLMVLIGVYSGLICFLEEEVFHIGEVSLAKNISLMHKLHLYF